MVLDTEEVYLAKNLTLVPANIGQLTRLHTLHLSTDLDPDAAANLAWVYMLTTLQDLTMALSSNSPADAIVNASLLTKLTCLRVPGQYDRYDFGPTLNIAIDWHRLQALQSLDICNVRLVLGVEIAGLLQLQHLKHITLESIATSSEDGTGLLVAFIDSLARR